MTRLSHPGRNGGQVLCFSNQELSACSLSAQQLTRAQCLRLVRMTLARAHEPIPLYMEVEAFPARQGLLVFVRPVFPGGKEDRYFSVTFS